MYLQSAENNITKILQYPKYFSVRWIEYTFNLLNAVLRNWKGTIAYFKKEREEAMLKKWLLCDRLHLLVFLADLLSLFKAFQKKFESNDVSIVDITPKKEAFVRKFENLVTTKLSGGWEELYFKQLVQAKTGKIFHGHWLKQNPQRKKTNADFECIFNEYHRKNIINALMQYLNERLDVECITYEHVKPLMHISTKTSHTSLNTCYLYLIPDLNRGTFYTEYFEAAESLKNFTCETLAATLKELHKINADKYKILKIALARAAVAKPHSADVERLISKL